MVLLDVLGERWTLRVLWELGQESLTFRELRKRCDDVSPTVLNRRLKTLRELDIVESGPNGYRCTEWGRSLRRQLAGLHSWSERWAAHLSSAELESSRSSPKALRQSAITAG